MERRIEHGRFIAPTRALLSANASVAVDLHALRLLFPLSQRCQVPTQAAGAGGRGTDVFTAGELPTAGRYVPRGGARAVRRGREVLQTQVRVDRLGCHCCYNSAREKYWLGVPR